MRSCSVVAAVVLLAACGDTASETAATTKATDWGTIATDSAPASVAQTTPHRRAIADSPEAPDTTQATPDTVVAVPAVEAEQVVPPEEPTRPSAPRDDGRRLLIVTSRPSRAVIRIRSSTGQVHVVEAPARVELVPGTYSWNAELTGYITTGSAQRTVNLEINRRDSVHVDLTPASTEVLYQQADAAYRLPDGSGCASAVSLYSQIARPASVEDVVGERWLESRLRLGSCAARIREFERAEEAFRIVIAADPSQWSPRFQLGQMLCDIRNDAARRRGVEQFTAMRRADGVSAELSRGVRLLGRYGETFCDHKRYAAEEFPERFPSLRDRIESGLDEFVPSAETYLRDAPAGELRAAVEAAVVWARAVQRELASGH